MNIKKICSALAGSLVLGLLLTPFASALPDVKAEGADVVIDATVYGADPTGQKDSTRAIQEAFAAAKQATEDGAASVTVSFPEGEYHIYKDYAEKKVYHTSNTNSIENPQKTIGLLIEDQENFTLEGNGSLFMMHGNMMALAVVNSKNVNLENFSWDFGVPTISEMTVTDMGTTDDGKPYTDFLIPECFPHAVTGNTITWYSEKSPYTNQYYWTQTGIHDPSYGIVTYQPDGEMSRNNYISDGPFTGVSQIEEIDDTHVRIVYQLSRPTMQKKGTVIELAANETRQTAGAFIWESENVTSDHVNVHYMHGFGWLVQMSRDVYFYNCNLTPREGSGHITVSFADGIHASGAAGELVIENCNFANTHDDPINLHGTFTRVEERHSDGHTLTLAYIHTQQGGFPQFHVGDKVAFFTRDTLESTDNETLYTVAEVVSNPGEDDNDLRTMVIRFEEELPADLSAKIGSEPKYVAENVTYAPEVTIKNCTFQQVPTRGILCTTRNKVLIEGNTFKNMSMATIFLSNDSDEWYESGPIRDMTIRNNVFYIRSIGRTWWEYAPPIYIHPVTKGGGLPSEDNPIHKNITIEGNTFHMDVNILERNAMGVDTGSFRTSDVGTVVNAESVENLIIRNNKVLRTNPDISISIEAARTEMLAGDSLTLKTAANGAKCTGQADNMYVFKACKNVVLEGNTYDDGLKNYAVLTNMSESNLTNKDEDITVMQGQGVYQASSPVANIQYESSDPSVISVDANGKMTGRKAGTATVNAYYIWDGEKIVSNSVEMEVKDSVAPEDAVTIQGDDGEIRLTGVDATHTFQAEVASGKEITWSVEDFLTGGETDKAVIDANGVLTAKKSGIVWVKASAGISTDRRAVIIDTNEVVTYLNPDFTITREDTANYTLSGDSITVDMQTGDLYNETNTVKNLFLYQIPESVEKNDMRTVIKVENLPVRENDQWDTASFILYKDDDNYITVGKKSHKDGIATVSETSGNATETSGNSSEDTLTTAYLGFYKNGNTVSVDFRTEGGEWQHVRDISADMLGNDYKIGFTAWESSDRGKTVTFSEFRVGSGGISYEELCRQSAISFMKADEDNHAPSGSDAVWDKATYEIGEKASVTYDYSDADGDEEGQTLYCFVYESGFTEVTDDPNVELKDIGKVVCRVYPVDAKGKVGDSVSTSQATVTSVDKTEPQRVLEEIQINNLDVYTEESKAAYTAALEKVQEVLKDAKATQAEITAALEELQTAKQALKLLPTERGGLEAAIDDAANLDLSAYTQESAAKYQEALAAAKQVAGNQAATQAEIDAALAALNTAKAGLVKRSDLGAGVQNPPSDHAANNVPGVGTVFDVNGIRYKITRSDAVNGTVAVMKLSGKKKAKLTIPATVKKDGYTFKVTTIQKNAFQKNTKLKTLVIGSNVTQIEKNVFYKCSKLKSITFKGIKAPKIGKKAFKGISAKSKIFVPRKMKAAQLKALKKRMKAAGAGSKVVYKKK